jgi:hypothetical protein
MDPLSETTMRFFNKQAAGRESPIGVSTVKESSEMLPESVVVNLSRRARSQYGAEQGEENEEGSPSSDSDSADVFLLLGKLKETERGMRKTLALLEELEFELKFAKGIQKDRTQKEWLHAHERLFASHAEILNIREQILAHP